MGQRGRVLVYLTLCCGLMLQLFCAGPIDPTNIYDPLNTEGDYRFSMVISPGSQDSSYALFYPYTILVRDTGNVHYRKFVIEELPILAKGTTRFLDGNQKGTIMFRAAREPCSLVVHAIRQNGRVDDDTLILSIENPYAIEYDTASYLQADTILFLIKNRFHVSAYDSSLTVHWRREGDETKDISFNEMLPVKATATDSIVLSAEITDTLDETITLTVVSIPPPLKKVPYVRIDAPRIEVPLNTEYSVNTYSRDADSLVWTTKHLTVTKATEATTKFTYRWTELQADTLIVTPKNRFGTIGGSDTVIISPQHYRFNIEKVTFPEEVLARQVWEWEVAVIDSNTDSAVDDSTIQLRWELEPNLFLKGAILDLNTDENRLRFHYPDTISSFILRVTAENETESSWCLESTIKVINHQPMFTSVRVVPRTIPVGDSVTFIISAIDTNSGGSVQQLYYKTQSIPVDFQVYTSDMTVRLPFDEPGEHEVYFWCVDNDGLVSDTVIRTVTVTIERPFFLKHEDDTTIYLGQNLILWGSASTKRENDSIVSWIWLDSTMNIMRVTTCDTIDTIFTEAGMNQINIRCISALGDTIDEPAIRNIRVSLGLPMVSDAVIGSQDSLFVNDSFPIEISARDSNGTIARLLVSCTPVKVDSASVDADTITISFDSTDITVDTIVTIATPRYSGVYAYSVIAVDNKGQYSSPRTADDSLVIHLGVPVVDGITPEICWMNDSVTFTIAAHDGNGSIISYWIRWGKEGSFAQTGSGKIRKLLPSFGEETLYCYVMDNDSLTSEIFSHSVSIRQGKPRIGSITTEASDDAIYINDSVTFILEVTDSNDADVTIASSWDGDTDFEQDNKDLPVGEIHLKHLFDPLMNGERTVQFKVTDVDGNYDTASFTFTVRDGAPSIASVSVDTADGYLFVNDRRSYTVKAEDPNGYLHVIYVNWSGDSIAQDSIIVEGNKNIASFSLAHRFGITDYGDRKIAFWTIDDDDVRSETFFKAVTVEKGLPVVEQRGIDTFWVKDENEITFKAKDPNGMVVGYFVDWDRNGDWDESGDASGIFTRTWDTIDGDKKVSFDVKATDEDSMSSKTVTMSVYIKMGRPVVRGMSYGDTIQWKKAVSGEWDTMFVVSGRAWYDETDSSYRSGPFAMRLEGADPNGKIVSYLWDLGANESVEYVSGEPYWARDMNIINRAWKYQVVARDDDSLTSNPLNFMLFVDEIPPSITTTSDIGEDGRIIKWSGKDVKDGDATLYKIVIKKGSSSDADSVTVGDEGDSRYIVKDFQPGNKYKKDDAFDFSYTYSPDQGNGIYHYRIIAKDARGSLSRTNGDLLFSFSEE